MKKFFSEPLCEFISPFERFYSDAVVHMDRLLSWTSFVSKRFKQNFIVSRCKHIFEYIMILKLSSIINA